MKEFINTELGEVWTLEELQQYFDYFKHDMIDYRGNLLFGSFKEYLEYIVDKGWIKECE